MRWQTLRGLLVNDWQLWSFVELCKPKVLLLMLSTAWVGMVLSPQTLPCTQTSLGILCGIFCIAAFGAVLNQFFENELDAKMHRTSHRPLVKKSLSFEQVYLFVFVLFILGTGLLLSCANVLTWTLTISGALGYACVYTLFLKHHTSQNIVIGGLYGATPPLLGWVALTNTLDPQALLLPLIIFIWTPPHFWALAIEKEQEYRSVGIPMLPVTHGRKFTALFILLYNILLYLVCLLPFLVGMLTIFYAGVSIILNSIYFVYNISVFQNSSKAAMKSFKFSICYLYILFLTMIIDKVLLS